ncbi:MAG TPA: hypothetical protein DEP42_00400 [Ruminococcaceae bacterium]|nr:hypothetical protein [Oscillospiraceae bacterium]
MKNFLRKYGLHIAVPLILTVLLIIATIFNYGAIVYVLLCFYFFFLPMFVWCVHTWEKEQKQNISRFLQRKGFYFWYKFRFLFVFYGAMIFPLVITWISTIQDTSESDSTTFIFSILCLPYLFGGMYIIPALIGIHLVRKKRMSMLDILFSTGMWYLLTIIFFEIPILSSDHLNGFDSTLGLFILHPILGSTCALFFSEIIAAIICAPK